MQDYPWVSALLDNHFKVTIIEAEESAASPDAISSPTEETASAEESNNSAESESNGKMETSTNSTSKF